MVERLGDPLVQDPREGHGGCTGMLNFVTRSESVPQAGLSHLRQGGAGAEHGKASSIVIGTWSEPVDRREESHPLTNARSKWLVKARSITARGACPERGNLVYMHGEFSIAEQPTAANAKYWAREETSRDTKQRRGLARGFWMFTSPTTIGGTPVLGSEHLARQSGHCGPPN